jgi:long-chain fatty acid transport protein
MMKLLLTVFLVLLCSASFSQGYQVNFQGQKQQGMASAGSALPQDASSVFFNPGAIGFLEKSSLNIGVTPTFANTLFEESGTNATARTESPVGTPFSVYGNFKRSEKSKFAYGIGIYTPFGSTIQWEAGWEGRYAMKRLELSAIFFQPTISCKISKKIGLGAGFVYSSGKVNLQKNIPIQDASGQDALAELNGSARGFGFNSGMYFSASSKLSFALTYRSRVNMEVKEGTATFTVPTSLQDNFPSGKFSSSLPLPQVLTVASAFKLSEKWNFALDINAIGWKAYDTLGFDYAQNTASLVDTRSARRYKNTLAFRTGAQFQLNKIIALRVGIAFGMSPVQSGYVTPETPDANRLNYTAGFSAKIGSHFSLDASVLFTHIERTDTNLETNLSGKFTTNVLAPGLAIIYQF